MYTLYLCEFEDAARPYKVVGKYYTFADGVVDALSKVPSPLETLVSINRLDFMSYFSVQYLDPESGILVTLYLQFDDKIKI